LRHSGLVTPRQLVIRERRPGAACTAWRGTPGLLRLLFARRPPTPGNTRIALAHSTHSERSRKSLRCPQPHYDVDCQIRPGLAK
jgi:hypothetical protein